MEALLQEVAENLGYAAARAEQQEAIISFLQGKDVFVSLPTGSGKSFCFYAIPLIFDKLKKHTEPRSVVVVLSPLLALMKNQVSFLESHGVSSIYITQDSECDDVRFVGVHEGRYQVLFFSPEALLSSSTWREMLQSSFYQENVVGLVIDEAHLVKKWGDSFRTAFSNLGEVCSILPKVNTMALTATATKETRKVICRSLGMKNLIIVSKSPNKQNIFYKVISNINDVEVAFGPLVDEIKTNREKMERTVVFCRTYDSCTHIYHFIRSTLGKEMSEPRGYVNCPSLRLVDMFTACTHPDIKSIMLKLLESPDSCLRVVIATIAFGMGLDVPNIRKVIHWGAPCDVETYMQETGRAGRDGKAATAILYSEVSTSRMVQDDSIKNYCDLKQGKCRRFHLLKYFDSEPNILFTTKCNCCDLCSLTCSCLACKTI